MAVRQAAGSSSLTMPRSTIGPRSLRALISCARTSTIGVTDSCGRPTSSSHKPKPLFASRRDQLNVRPIWHQRQDRVQAHILVCFLAFVLWKSLEMWQQRAGLGNSPRTILEELAHIQSYDLVFPTETHGQIRLRCVTQPDPAQTALLDRLGIVLPKRMRLADNELPPLAHTA